jgi:hypothetical protein
MILTPLLRYSKITFFLLLSVCSTTLTAQKKVRESKWIEKNITPSTIPDSLLQLDAVSVFYHQKITVYFDVNTGGKTTISVSQRFKILTMDGKRLCDKFSIQKPDKSKIIELDAITIKPNGDIIHFETSDLKLISQQLKTSSAVLNKNEYKLAIPNVSIGDEVELRYQLALPYMVTAQDLYFNTDFHSMKSTITLSFEKLFMPDIRTFNGLGSPQKREAFNYIDYTWTVNNVPSQGNNLYSIPAFSEPCVSYSIRYLIRADETTVPIVKNQWGNLYEDIHKYLALKSPSSKEKKSLDAFLATIKSKQINSSKTLLLQALVDTLNTFNIVREAFLPKDYSISNMINEGKTSNISLYGFYLRAFEYYDIPFYIGLMRNKYQGLIYPDYVSVNHITDFILVIPKTSKEFVYIYPSISTKIFKINEYPFKFENTNSVLIDKSCINNLHPTFDYVNLPVSTISDNYSLYRYQITIDTTDSNHIITGQSKYSGHLVDHNLKNDSAFFKQQPLHFSSFTNLVKDETATNFPYKVSYKVSGRCEPFTQSVNDSIFTIDINAILVHEYPELPMESKRDLHYFGPYPYSNTYQYAILFPYEIKLLTPIEFTEINGFQYTVKQQSPNLIYINSMFKFSPSIIHAEDYHTLHQNIESHKQEISVPIYLQKL